jgi:hypothetical protein
VAANRELIHKDRRLNAVTTLDQGFLQLSLRSYVGQKEVQDNCAKHLIIKGGNGKRLNS